MAAKRDDRWSWVDDRIDWVPDEDPGQCGITIREAHQTDSYTLKYLCREYLNRKVSDRTIWLWLTSNMFVVRLACRNLRHVVALCVSKHTPEENEIVAYWASSPYTFTKSGARLLIAAALEKPEVRTVVKVAATDTVAHNVYRGVGWGVVHVERDSRSGEATEFWFGLDPLVRRGTEAADPVDRPKDPVSP